MVVSRRLSKEERVLDKQDTLEMLKQGVTHAEIARQLGRSTQYIVNLKNELVVEGLITIEEIKKARKQAIDAKKRSEKSISESKAAEKERIRNEKKAKALEYLNLGITILEISRKLDIPRTTLNRYIVELINEGKVKEEDIKSQKGKNKEVSKNVQEKNEELIVPPPRKSKSKKKFIPNPDAILSEEEKQVLDYLLKGQSYNFIAKEMGITQSEVVKNTNILKVKGVISSEQIKSARERKLLNDEEDVIKLLKRGYTQADIKLQKRDTINLSIMISKLKAEGRITDGEIKKAQEQARRLEKEELAELVLKGMKKGLTVKEIIESDETRICNRKVR